LSRRPNIAVQMREVGRE